MQDNRATTPDELQNLQDDVILEKLAGEDPDGTLPWEGKEREGRFEPATPLDSLLLKLDNWLLMQPEWLVILDAPRRTRRQAINLLSKHILTFPARGRTFGGGR